MTEIQTQLRNICVRRHIEIMYTYGSRSSEIKSYVDGNGIVKQVTRSDVDIGIKTSREVHLFVKDKVSLAIDLEDLLGVSRVDLIVLAEADPFLAANVIRGDRIYCLDEYMADEYELYILRRAGDLAHLEHERLNLIFGGSS